MLFQFIVLQNKGSIKILLKNNSFYYFYFFLPVDFLFIQLPGLFGIKSNVPILPPDISLLLTFFIFKWTLISFISLVKFCISSSTFLICS